MIEINYLTLIIMIVGISMEYYGWGAQNDTLKVIGFIIAIIAGILLWKDLK